MTAYRMDLSTMNHHRLVFVHKMVQLCIVDHLSLKLNGSHWTLFILWPNYFSVCAGKVRIAVSLFINKLYKMQFVLWYSSCGGSAVDDSIICFHSKLSNCELPVMMFLCQLSLHFPPYLTWLIHVSMQDIIVQCNCLSIAPYNHHRFPNRHHYTFSE